MALEPPRIDDRTFADLYGEARSRIQRYAPEWTNHNDSDPGITMLQQLAWLTELTIYRLNQVPELHYVKLLQLLGIQLASARPARVDLTFTPARPDVEFVTVPQGTQVAAQGGPGGKPIVFELPQAFVAIGARLAAVQGFDGYTYTDLTAANGAAGQWFHPFGAHAHIGSALLLGFDSPVDFTAQSIDLACYTQTRAIERPAVQCAHGDLAAGLPPPATFAFEYWDTLHWETVNVLADHTRAFTQDGHLVLAGPGAAARRGQVGVVTTPLYWIRIRLVSSTYELPPRLQAVQVNTVTAVQAQASRNEVLGGSDGTPGQGGFRLANRPILDLEEPFIVRRSDGRDVTVYQVHLEIDEGSGFEAWQQVGDFAASGPDDPHFTCDSATGEVRFGEFSRIPLANAANPTGNIVARLYGYGGGRAGNVGAGTVSALQTFAPGIKSVTNLRPATGGADEETVDGAKRRAPGLLKARDRAVTAEDFEVLSLATVDAAIRRAKALPMHHREFPDVPIPGVVSVIVVPDGDGPAPVPSEVTLRAVCAHLNAHRLVTSELYVLPPRYRRVQVSADIVVRGDADLATVSRALADRINEFLHPLAGGLDGTGWPFGGTIYYSTLCGVVLDVPGVDRIDDNQLTIEVDGRVADFCRDVPIGVGELLEPLEPQLRVRYT